MIKLHKSAQCALFLGFLATASCAVYADQAPGGTQVAQTAGSPTASSFWIGANIFAVEFTPTAQSNGRSAGVRLDFIKSGTAAEKAGLHEGDVLLSYDGKPTVTVFDLLNAVNSAGAKAASVELLRDGRNLRLAVQAQVRPKNDVEIVTAAETERIATEENVASKAKAAGNFAAAFRHYVVALRLLIAQSRRGVDLTNAINSDVAQLAEIIPKLPSRPGLTSEADRHVNRAVAILKAASSDEDNDNAASEFWSALYEAPWISANYLNLGLVMARSGFPKGAAADLRIYSMLDPSAADAASIKQKIAELEVVADEQKPWFPFLTTYPIVAGGTETVSLRDRRLMIVASKGNGTVQAGEVLCSGAIHGTKFNGKCANYMNKPEAVRCFGSKVDREAEGEIDGNHVLTIRMRSTINFDVQTCQVNSQDWEVIQKLSSVPSSPK